MKQLQNNFTTPEQSKLLLELGVPADSADLCNVIPTGYVSFCRDKKFSDIRNELISVSKTRYHQIYTEDDIIPCWSVGRLIEIFIICTPYVEIRLRTRLIEQLIASYEDVIKQSLMDFSKLEK